MNVRDGLIAAINDDDILDPGAIADKVIAYIKTDTLEVAKLWSEPVMMFGFPETAGDVITVDSVTQGTMNGLLTTLRKIRTDTDEIIALKRTLGPKDYSRMVRLQSELQSANDFIAGLLVLNIIDLPEPMRER